MNQNCSIENWLIEFHIFVLIYILFLHQYHLIIFCYINGIFYYLACTTKFNKLPMMWNVVDWIIIGTQSNYSCVDYMYIDTLLTRYTYQCFD